MVELLAVAVLGWGSGAFINYMADTLPIKRKITTPFCSACGASQSSWNYFIWSRRCLVCGNRRSIRTYFVEIIAIGVTLWLWFSPPSRLGFIIGLILLVYFGVVMVIDLEHRLILHPVSLVGGILGLVIGIWLHGLLPTLAGGAAGFGIMLLLYYFGKLFSKLIARSRGETFNEDALGFGDVILGGVLGLILGWPGIVLGIILALLIGGLVSLFFIVIMLVRRNYRSFVAIPYGPFLIAGAVALLYFKELINSFIGP